MDSRAAAIVMTHMKLRFVTYNIHKCRGLDARVRPGRIANVLKEVNADVIALQEVVNIEGARREKHQAEFLSKELELFFSIGKNKSLNGGAYGNVTLSRFPILRSRHYDISVPRREPRGCLRVDIATEKKQLLHIFNVHLGTGLLERRKQAARLVDDGILLNRELSGIRIVLGDFNEWTRGTTTRLLAANFQSVRIEKDLPFLKTYPGFFPFLHLDHIYFQKELHLDSLRIHKSRTALLASDHLPIIADFSIG